MSHSRNIGFILLVAGLVLVIVTAPYLYAQAAGGPDYQFRGFLLNPIDGNTYLAKIYQGYRGDWLFTLSYTVERSRGVLIYPFYLGLGHLARLTGLAHPLVYHLARLAAVLVLLWALYRFCKTVLPEGRQGEAAFGLAALGSGMGWLVSLAGGFTADMWVAEGYPFLSAYSSPHFSFSLAILLWTLTPPENTNEPLLNWKVLLAGLLLALTSPFGVVVAALVLGGAAIWETWAAGPIERRPLQRLWASWAARRAVAVGLGGGWILLYDLWVMRMDPVLAGWNAQNVTPAPPLWDMVVSLSPALILALFGAYRVFRHPHQPAYLLVVWACLGLALTYFPWSLQRRFMMGIYVPVAGLAVVGLYHLVADARRRRLLLVMLVGFSFLSHFLILFAGLHGIQTRDLALYVRWDEAAALEWIETETAPGAVILAGPDTGLLIPAFTGRRVIYGHPFETVQAGQREQEVVDYYLGENQAIVAQYAVDYIWWGPRERDLTGARAPAGPQAAPVFAIGEVSLYDAAP